MRAEVPVGAGGSWHSLSSHLPYPAAANLTAQQLQKRIRSVADLPGKRVATWEDQECEQRARGGGAGPGAARCWSTRACAAGRGCASLPPCSALTRPSATLSLCRHHRPGQAQHRCPGVSGGGVRAACARGWAGGGAARVNPWPAQAPLCPAFCTALPPAQLPLEQRGGPGGHVQRAAGAAGGGGLEGGRQRGSRTHAPSVRPPWPPLCPANSRGRCRRSCSTITS